MILAFSLHAFPFPPVNAALNGTSAVLLLAGYACIRARKVAAHRAFVTTAFCVSTLFLILYLTGHAVNGMTNFPPTPWRPVYWAILGTHTILAIATVPLVIVTFRRALRGDFVKHRQIAVWTFPIWLYVSVTGVVVYFMLSASGAYEHAKHPQAGTISASGLVALK